MLDIAESCVPDATIVMRSPVAIEPPASGLTRTQLQISYGVNVDERLTVFPVFVRPFANVSIGPLYWVKVKAVVFRVIGFAVVNVLPTTYISRKGGC